MPHPVEQVGWSPQDIEACAADKADDLMFIDGAHTHPQVTRDFEGARHLARERTIICWRDYWLAGIPASVEAARSGRGLPEALSRTQ